MIAQRENLATRRKEVNKTRLLAATIAPMMLVAVFAAGCEGDKQYVRMSYYDGTTYEEGAEYSIINENLFYRNTRQVDIADPSVVYVSDEADPDYGSYFLYGTTSSTTGFFCWKSEDLLNWDAIGYALKYDDFGSTEARSLKQDIWAPEVIYDEEEDKWYLFFSATPDTPVNTDSAIPTMEYQCIPYVAVSDSPRGPFNLIDHTAAYKTTEGTPLSEVSDLDENRDYFFQRYMTFDPYSMHQRLEELGVSEDGCDLIRAIDFHPYVDPATQEKYLYFALSHNSYICGMKMEDWNTPVYSSLVVLTRPGYSSMTAEEKDLTYESTNNHVNEGPWMTEHGGKYYLTFSINSSTLHGYSVCQAVGDTPLGSFRKLTEAEGAVLLSADSSRDDVSGTGHHTIVTVGGKEYILYHSHNSVEAGGFSRHLAFDPIEWVTVKDGADNDLPVMYVNGPTTSVQPLPEYAAEYCNIAAEAEVEATALADGSSASWMTDGLLSVNRYMNYDMVETYVQESAFTGKTTVTLTFDDYKTVRALMVYNSKNMQSAFYEIERIEFDCKEEDGSEVTRFIDRLAFDWKAYTAGDPDVIRPASAAYAEFAEIRCKTIRITIAPATEEQIAVHGMDDMPELSVSEIRVLGK